MDTVYIKGGRVFSGYNRPSKIANILVQDGKVSKISEQALDLPADTKIVDATGKWVTPGFFDNHTHYDGELLVAPQLSESIRHGVTTVLVGSCSLSFVYSDVEDCCDMFTRVEAFPREILNPILEKEKNWDSPKSWIEHIKKLPLGPNIGSFIGHSDIRSKVMGIDRSLDPKEIPTAAEIKEMQDMLNDAIDHGMLGISMQHNPWDKMDGRHWSKLLPAAYATRKERNAMASVARERNGHLQGVPNLVNRLAIFWYLGQSANWFGLRKKKLKTSIVAMMELKGDPYIRAVLSFLAKTYNKFLGANFRFQGFPVPFTNYVKGMDLVIFEEFPSGELARHLSRDLIERNKTLKDPEYRKQFKKHYGDKLSPKVWQKDFGDAYILNAPDKSWIGKSFMDLAKERNQHPVDTFLDVVIDLDDQVEWKTTIGNENPAKLSKLYNDEGNIIGFADSGAHINNMAFYNFPIRMIKYVKDSHERGEPCMPYEKLIWRLTKENADFFNIDAGTIEEGKRADLVVIDFENLDDSIHQYYKAEFLSGIERLVNRDDKYVNYVMISGKTVWENGQFDERVGKERFGDYLPGKHLAEAARKSFSANIF
jgi:N-acyl-D-aspartate/D-glutamate deacylase